jgi:hypothetical protein
MLMEGRMPLAWILSLLCLRSLRDWFGHKGTFKPCPSASGQYQTSRYCRICKRKLDGRL